MGREAGTVFDNDKTLFIITFKLFFFATPPSKYMAIHQAATTTLHNLLLYSMTGNLTIT